MLEEFVSSSSPVVKSPHTYLSLADMYEMSTAVSEREYNYPQPKLSRNHTLNPVTLSRRWSTYIDISIFYRGRKPEN